MLTLFITITTTEPKKPTTQKPPESIRFLCKTKIPVCPCTILQQQMLLKISFIIDNADYHCEFLRATL